MAEEWQELPSGWVGSRPEYAIYWALLQLRYMPDVDFIYQSPQAGGRQEFGGAVLDFLFPERSLAINIQSVHYHYAQTSAIVHDQLIRAMMESWGVRVIYIDEDAALREPIYYVKEALAGRDHSRIGR